MKRFIVLFALICTILIIPGRSNSTTIDLISESYNLNISERNFDAPAGFRLIADIQNSPSPVYAYYDSLTVGGTPFALAAYASGCVLNSSIFLDTYVDEFAKGIAFSEVLFNPVGASLINVLANVQYSGTDAWPSIQLIDNTAGQTLLSLGKSQNMNATYSFSFPVDPSHLYFLKSRVEGTFADTGYASVNLNLVSTPEPTTMLLLGLGLVGLTAVRRKFKE